MEEENIICSICGEETNDGYEVQGDPVCADCHDGEVFTCADCGEVFLNDDENHICIDCGQIICSDCATLDGNDDAVCDACRGRNYWVLCEDCGTWSQETTCVNGVGQVCDVCLDSGDYFACGDCLTIFRVNYGAGECLGCHDPICHDCANLDDHQNIVCDGCHDEYFICEECGRWTPHDDAYCDGDWIYCENCYERRRTALHAWDYRPDPVFYGQGPRYYGIELEVDKGDDREDCVSAIVDAADEIYCKCDGSLCRGIEIVSHPASYEYHRDALPWKKIMAIALQYGYTSHDAGTCGLHIHLSRRGFGATHMEQEGNIAKLLYIVERFWDQVLRFSRRTPKAAQEWARRYCESGHVETNLEVLLSNAKREGRYHAVNLQNEETVELRIFRGTLQHDSFLATLQFARLLVETVTSKTVAEIQAMTWNDLVGDIKGYPELLEYLKRRELVNLALSDPVPVQSQTPLFTLPAQPAADPQAEYASVLVASNRLYEAVRRSEIPALDDIARAINFNPADPHSVHWRLMPPNRLLRISSRLLGLWQSAVHIAAAIQDKYIALLCSDADAAAMFRCPLPADAGDAMQHLIRLLDRGIMPAVSDLEAVIVREPVSGGLYRPRWRATPPASLAVAAAVAVRVRDANQGTWESAADAAQAIQRSYIIRCAQYGCRSENEREAI